MKNDLFLILFGVLSTLIISSCGVAGASSSKSIDVTLTDFAFSPNTFTVPAGAQISLTAVNNGAASHSFLIIKKGIQLKGPFTDSNKSDVFWGTDQIASGTSLQATFIAPGEPGQYQIVCGVPGHLELGMLATLIVVNP